MKPFKLISPYKPCGDQPQAIKLLHDGLKRDMREQVLLGVTGSGKTFTIANVIAKSSRPVLVISHNKTLAAQLYSELKEFFPVPLSSMFDFQPQLMKFYKYLPSSKKLP